MQQFFQDMGTVGTWITVVVGVILGAVALVGFTLMLANVMRRVLGVPVGWPRSIFVSALVSVGTVVVLWFTVFPTGVMTESDLGVLGGIILVIVTLLWMLGLGAALLMISELVLPTGTLPSLGRWLVDWPERRKRNRRYRQVMGIFFRHGLTSNMPGLNRKSSKGKNKASENHSTTVERAARSLRIALEESGTTFVKLGQNLANRDDVLPKAFTRELARLHASATPESWEDIRGALESSLGTSIDEAFGWVDEEPMAAASVAQVHRAKLLDGTPVVLKVQRPGTREEVTRDSDIVTRLCTWLERHTDWGRDLGIRRLAGGFTESLAEELDYTVEAANMQDIEVACQETGVIMPHVYEEHSSTRLLVMDELHGTPVASADQQLATLSQPQRTTLAKSLIVSVMRQVLRYGVFHADVHPGNVLIMPDGNDIDGTPRVTLGMLDFGAVGRLDSATRKQLTMVFAAIERSDARALTDTLIAMLDRPQDLEEKDLHREVGELLVRYRGGLNHGSTIDLLSRMMQIVMSYRLVVPDGVTAAMRCLAETEGTLRKIDPEYNIIETAREEGAALTKDRFQPSNMKDSLESALLETMPMIRDFPRQVSRITEDIQEGRMTMNTRMLGDPGDRAFLTRLLQQFTVAIIAGFCVLGGVVLIAFGNAGPMLLESLTLHAALGYVVLFAGFMLSLRTVTMVLFRKNKR